MGLLKFEPLYQERVWGGRGLEQKLGRTLPDDGVYGESWEVVDRTEAQSVVREGPEQGKTLRTLLDKDADRIMGPGWESGRPFPILVKWLDCKERLSLQVHPPAAVAPELGGEPKTENWYIAESEPGASLIVGLKPGVTKDAFANAIKDQTLEELVQRFEVHPGESLFVPSGRLHAIDGGNLILEIQQNSDTTYRVYDWGRVGLDGKPRQLHVEQSLRSIDWDDTKPEPIRPKPGAASQVIADSEIFRLTVRRLKAGEVLRYEANTQPRLVSVVEGALRDRASATLLERSENVLLPYAEAFELEAAQDSVVIVTDGFAPVGQ